MRTFQHFYMGAALATMQTLVLLAVLGWIKMARPSSTEAAAMIIGAGVCLACAGVIFYARS